MCRGISILKARIKQELFEEYELAKLVHRRTDQAAEELWFDFADRSMPTVLLPVEQDGQLTLMEWGNRGGRVERLPKTGWCREESLQSGAWSWLQPEPAVIPADFALEKGVWFPVEQGVRAVVVRDQQERPHAYVLTAPASHYYAMMTKHDRMPVLVGQVV